MIRFIAQVCFFLATIPFSFSQDIQWACRVMESNDISTEPWGPKAIIGVPNVYPQNRVGSSWQMGHLDDQNEMEGEVFITVQFCKTIVAQQIVIAENFNPGAITKIILYDVKGNEREVYNGVAKTDTSIKNRMLSVTFSPMAEPIRGAKIVADPSKVEGPNCIDAVALSTSKNPIKIEINIYKDEKFLPTVHTLGPTINTQYDEFAPIVSPDGKKLYFARLGDPRNIGGENGDIDIYYSEKDSKGNWTMAKNIGQPLNNKDHNVVVSAAADGNVLLLGNTYTASGNAKGEGASISNKTKEGWGKPENLKILDYNNSNEHVAFFLANNEKALLMALEDKDQSFGEQDLYVSFLQKEGTWSPPMNLGSTINTVNGETNMFLAPDNVTLYFTSNGFNGYGGYDIYVSRRLDDSWQRWTTPLNLGPLVNTPEDEYSFVITADGKFAFGYKYMNEEQKHDLYIIGLPVTAKIRPEAVVMVSGKVLHSDTKQPLGAKIIYETLPDGKEVGIAHSNPEDGSYEIILPKGKKYGFMASAQGYVAISENIEVPDKSEYMEMERDLFLVPIEVGKTVKLNNIFFQKNLPDLIDDSYPELDKIVQFLIDNPNVVIRLEGHTDNLGSPAKMMELSEKRVEAVRDYLVTKNIDPKRLQFKAYGGSKPVASNASEETRKLNRRVEFVILQK